MNVKCFMLIDSKFQSQKLEHNAVFKHIVKSFVSPKAMPA